MNHRFPSAAKRCLGGRLPCSASERRRSPALFSAPSHEEERHPRHTDERAHHFAARHTLAEEHMRRPEDEHGRERHDRHRHPRRGVLRGHERERHPHKGAKHHRGRHEQPAAAISAGTAQRVALARQEEDEQKARQSRHGAHLRGGKRQEKGRRRPHLRRRPHRRIVFQAHGRERQPQALPHSRTDAQQHAARREIEAHFAPAPPFPLLVGRTAAENRHGDARGRHRHAKQSLRREPFAQQAPPRQSRNRRRDGHKELTEARTDEQIGVEQAIVAEHIAHQPGRQEPAPRRRVGLGRQGRTGADPQQRADEEEREHHAQHVHHVRTETAAHRFAQQGAHRPRDGHRQRDRLAEITSAHSGRQGEKEGKERVHSACVGPSAVKVSFEIANLRISPHSPTGVRRFFRMPHAFSSLHHHTLRKPANFQPKPVYFRP